MGWWKKVRKFLGSDADERAYNRAQTLLASMPRNHKSRETVIKEAVDSIFDGTFDRAAVERELWESGEDE